MILNACFKEGCSFSYLYTFNFGLTCETNVNTWCGS